MYYFETSTDEFSRISWAAVLYSAGRMTYMPSFVQDVISTNAQFLQYETANEMREYIEELEGEGSLGMDFDAIGWMQFKDGLTSMREGEPAGPASVEFLDATDLWLFLVGALRFDIARGGVITPEEYADIISRNIDAMNDKWYANYMEDLGRATKWNPEPNEYFAAGAEWDVVEEVLRDWYDSTTTRQLW